MPRIYFIAGTPGVGKSTLGRLLSQKAGLKFIELRSIVQADRSDNLLEVDGRTLSSKAGKILREQQADSLIATHIAFKPRGLNVERVFVLRRNPFLVIDTLKSRGYPEEKVLENAEAEFLGIVYLDMLKKFGPQKTWQINVSNRSIDESIDLLLSGIRGEDINEDVDWTRILELDKSLDDLLLLFSRRSKLI